MHLKRRCIWYLCTPVLTEGFPRGSVVKNLPPVKETWIQSLGWEDPLEKEMATYPSIVAWEILWTEVRDIVQETGIKTIPKKKKCKKAKWLSEEALQIAVKRAVKKRSEKQRRKGQI